MQAQLGSEVIGHSVTVHYAYVARYRYSDVVVQNDNFLRLSAYSDRYQTAGPCYVGTLPAGRLIAYPDQQGEPGSSRTHHRSAQRIDYHRRG